jgi:hypothetical protein
MPLGKQGVCTQCEASLGEGDAYLHRSAKAMRVGCSFRREQPRGQLESAIGESTRIGC